MADRATALQEKKPVYPGYFPPKSRVARDSSEKRCSGSQVPGIFEAPRVGRSVGPGISSQPGPATLSFRHPPADRHSSAGRSCRVDCAARPRSVFNRKGSTAVPVRTGIRARRFAGPDWEGGNGRRKVNICKQ